MGGINNKVKVAQSHCYGFKTIFQRLIIDVQRLENLCLTNFKEAQKRHKFLTLMT
ncbi:hypothetical protein [Legionella sainthelensi]|uniref:hypothetical protein n=1 Tax=Legionella sainthelensi TaxID=28087 RepID=UPI001356CF7E|nr:hypothetical protein [Legionella sainthelensi]